MLSLTTSRPAVPTREAKEKKDAVGNSNLNLLTYTNPALDALLYVADGIIHRIN